MIKNAIFIVQVKFQLIKMCQIFFKSPLKCIDADICKIIIASLRSNFDYCQINNISFLLFLSRRKDFDHYQIRIILFLLLLPFFFCYAEEILHVKYVC